MNFTTNDLLNIFPNEITVTDQVLDISNFSDTWKTNVAELAVQIFDIYTNSNKDRFIATLGGASGSSKSTTAKVLEIVLSQIQNDVDIITVGQDAYHHYHDYLLNNVDSEGIPLANHKGRYDTFDVEMMKKDIEDFIGGQQVSFPEYSRKIHNPIPDTIVISHKPTILIFEGLWLLYDQQPWNKLLEYYDLTIFLHAPDEIRKNNTISRHIRGNEHSEKDAEIFYKKSDLKNSELILNNISHTNINLSIL